MTIKAWIIALNPENPIALALQRTLLEQDIDAEIKPAVDGRSAMPAFQGREVLSQRQSLIYRRSELTSAEVGCYLSHYRLIQQAWDEGLSHICLFEDDVVAEEGIGELLRGIVTLDDSAHLVRLMQLKIRKRKIVQDLPAGYTLVRPLRGALGTQGYVVNRTGMKKILDYGSTIYLPIDKLYDNFFLYDLKCFCVEPHAVYEIVRATSVRKAKEKRTNSFILTAYWQSSKLIRSVHRRIHFLTHKQEFTPAKKPTDKIGKSLRTQ